MKMLRLLLAAALILAPFEQALAGAGTITTKDAAGATRTFVVVTDGTGNFVAPTVICDATAAATCAGVGANGLAVSSTLAAETTKVIGVVRNADGAGNLLTSTGAALDINIKTGSIANTTFAVTNAGTFAAQLTGATNNINNIAGTVSLPTGASTSANQTNGTQQTKVTDGSNVAAVKAASTAPVATDPAMVVAVSPNVSYTFYTNSATGTTGATTATLAGAASVTTYICGFSIRANATAAATGNATVTGTISGTLNFTQWTAPTASGVGVTEEIFSPCIPASATNTSIAVVSAAPGTGGVVSSTVWGYKL